MNRKNDDSKRIKTAAISLCTVAVILVVFTVAVYRSKRSSSGEFDEQPGTESYTQQIPVTNSDIPADLQVESGSGDTVSSEAVSSAEEVSSATADTSANSDILNPDKKSDYYMVVYTGSQMIVVYQKDDSGEYTHTFHYMKCSTGALDSTPTKEGVYTIEKKERWTKLGDREFVQYSCFISEAENYYISSIPYSQKNAWMMKDGGYENIGKGYTGGNIQLCVRDAYWIYKNMPKGTQINVVNRTGPELKIKDLPKRVKKNGGWDPTDKWSKGNPYFATATKASSTTTTTQAQEPGAVG